MLGENPVDEHKSFNDDDKQNKSKGQFCSECCEKMAEAAAIEF
jgi:hypothetical protein